MQLSAWRYRLRSIPTLLRGFHGKRAILTSMLSPDKNEGFQVEIANTGLTFILRDLLDLWILKEVCLDQCYFPEGMRLPAEPVVVDIGACFGAFSIDIAYQYPGSTVFAYEPFEPSFRLLRDNVAQNQVKNIKTHHCAVEGHQGQTKLQLHPRGPLLHSTVDATKAKQQAEVPVEATTLDAIIAELPGGQCDMLKIDCEGSEFDILFHTSIENLQKVNFIALEYHDQVTSYHHSELVQFLEAVGFEVECIPSPVYSWLGQINAVRLG